MENYKRIKILIMEKIVLLILMFSASSLFAQTSDIIISECVEGSGNNKAIEIFNGTGTAVNLSNYRLEKDLNGNGNFTYYHNFTGTLNNGEVYVIAHPYACDEIKNVANLLKQVITDFTGNDQIRLLKNGVEIDRIGVPGDINFGYNKTFVRKSAVTNPLSGPQNPQTNGEWTEYPTNTFDNLGSHSFENNSSGSSSLWNSSGSNIFRESGNVGIGTTNPQYGKLQVNGEGVDNGITLYRGTTGSTTGRFWIDINDYMHITRSNSTDKGIIIKPNGNMGIGTFPLSTTKFFVRDADYTTAGDKVIAIFKRNFNSDGHGAGLYITSDAKGTTGIVKLKSTGYSAQNMGLGPTGLDIYIQKNTGNVGIGTTNPGTYKLAVNGKIKAHEVNISLTGWSDFVFQEGYELKKLNEVEKYICKNKHLPDIPSKSEVLKNGVNVGEMNKVLLQKIEELTLYVIDLKKEN
ncbi:MAG: hypothetical protein DRJ01_14915, partial [Bacteroidetes bacterium]